MTTEIDWEALRDEATRVRENAYAPYSNFRVGAALLDDEGTVHKGANVENASYGLALCAERSAIASAVAMGKRRFVAIAIVTGADEPASPCGMCRQVLAELAPSIPVRSYTLGGAVLATDSDSLLPHAFTLRPDRA